MRGAMNHYCGNARKSCFLQRSAGAVHA
jgi:hypothetical protein